jgi:tripartite-type tricarboxylate transporter receptor subunit TctC
MTRLNREVNAALNHRETRDQFAVMGVEATPSTPQQADAHIRAEVQRWLKTLKAVAR